MYQRGGNAGRRPTCPTASPSTRSLLGSAGQKKGATACVFSLLSLFFFFFFLPRPRRVQLPPGQARPVNGTRAGAGHDQGLILGGGGEADPAGVLWSAKRRGARGRVSVILGHEERERGLKKKGRERARSGRCGTQDGGTGMWPACGGQGGAREVGKAGPARARTARRLDGGPPPPAKLHVPQGSTAGPAAPPPSRQKFSQGVQKWVQVRRG